MRRSFTPGKLNTGSGSCVPDYKRELQTLQKLLGSSLDIISSIDKEGRFIYVSTAARQVWGFDPAELTGKTAMEMVAPKDLERTFAMSRTILAGEDVTSFENHYIRKDGTLVPMIWSARWCAEEQVAYCVAKDATRLKETEKEKQVQDNRLRRAFQLAGLAWWEYDVASHLFTCSDELFRMYNRPVPPGNQITTDILLSWVHTDDVAKLQYDLSTISDDIYRNYEHRIVKPTGEAIDVVHFVEVTRDEQRNAIAVHGTTKEITGEKNREKLLQQSIERYEIASRATSDALWDWDIEANTCYFNQSFTNLFGYEHRHGSVQDNWMENLHEKDKPTLVASVEAALQNASVCQWEGKYRFYRNDRSVAFILDRGFIIRDAQGKAIRMVGSMQDITKLQEAECAIAKSERRFKAMVQSGKDLIMLLSASFDVLYTSPNYKEETGYDHDELSGLLSHEKVHPDDYEEAMLQAQNIFTEPIVMLPYLRFKIKNGEYRWYEAVLSNHLANPDINAIVANIRDVTAKVLADDEMQKLSLVAKETTDAVVITDANVKITWVNQAFIDSTGYTPQEAIGRTPSELLQGPNSSQRMKAYLQKCIEQQRPFNCEILNYTKSGNTYWAEAKGQPIFNERGELKQYLAIHTDITARKEADALIRSSEEKYKFLFYNSPQPKWIFDAGTLQVVDVNSAAVDLYGYSKTEFLNLKIPELTTPEDVTDFFAIIDALRTDKLRQFDKAVRHKKKNGETVFIAITGFTIQLPTGLHIICTGNDMTEKLQLQQTLMEEKIAAQKEISRAILQTQEKERSEIGGELHDNVCQLLTTSKLYIENTKYFPDHRDEFMQKGVDLLLQSINEIRFLSRQLATPVMRDMGFKATIEELIKHYLSLNIFAINLNFAVCEEEIAKDMKLTIYRILQEQFNNTVKYAKASAIKVSLTTRQHFLLLHYQDDGIGFDPASPKAGLGLKNIQNRADAFRGTVQLTTAPGKGCTVRISFPLK